MSKRRNPRQKDRLLRQAHHAPREAASKLTILKGAVAALQEQFAEIDKAQVEANER